MKMSSKNNDSQIKISEEEKNNTLKNNILKSKRTNLGIASSNKNKNKSGDKTNNNKAIVNNYESEKSKYELENDMHFLFMKYKLTTIFLKENESFVYINDIEYYLH